MYERDYIVRLIEQFGVFMRRIFGDTDPGQALRTIDEAMEFLLGFDGSFIHSLTDDSLLSLLRVGGGFDVERALMLADLFAVEADVLDAQGRPDLAELRRRKALVLVLEVSAAGDKYDAVESDERIKAFWTHAGPLARAQWAKLFRHFARMEDSALAEDAVFQLLKVGDPEGADRGFRGDAAAYLEGLLARTDAELAEAGIVRARVEESLALLAGPFDEIEADA